MRPVLYVKLVDLDTGREIDRLERAILPSKTEYYPLGDIWMKTWRWVFAYTRANNELFDRFEESRREENARISRE